MCAGWNRNFGNGTPSLTDAHRIRLLMQIQAGYGVWTGSFPSVIPDIFNRESRVLSPRVRTNGRAEEKDMDPR